MYYIIKIVASAILIILISEIAKKGSFWGTILASLPFISIIAFIFLFRKPGILKRFVACPPIYFG